MGIFGRDSPRRASWGCKPDFEGEKPQTREGERALQREAPLTCSESDPPQPPSPRQGFKPLWLGQAWFTWPVLSGLPPSGLA